MGGCGGRGWGGGGGRRGGGRGWAWWRCWGAMGWGAWWRWWGVGCGLGWWGRSCGGWGGRGGGGGGGGGGVLRLRPLRLAGLGLTAVVVAKVFLVDMSGLDGLWRVLSFLGLGLGLMALGALYRRFGGVAAE